MRRFRDMLTSDNLREWAKPWRAALSSLQFKASLLVIGLVLGVVIVGLGLSLRLASDALYGQAQRFTADWAKTLANAAGPAIVHQDNEALVRAVNDALWTHNVVYMAVSDAQYRVLASGEQINGLLPAVLADAGRTMIFDRLGTVRVIRGLPTGLSCIDVTLPIYRDDAVPGDSGASRRVVGYIRLGTDVGHVDAQMRQIAGRLRGVSIGLLLLVASCTLIAMRKVVAPLNELSRTAKELAGGVMDARANVALQNEIGDLARAFNDMAGRLANAQFEMLRLNSELEERVQQRTHQLEDLAAREPLTGLYNRRYFTDVITREFAAAERYDADLTCLMVDLDHFKETNDRFGHRAGDGVLIMLAQCIRKELRDADVAARFGGDEFILLLPRTSATSAGHVADRIASRFAEMLRLEAPELPPTLSIGVASLRMTRARSAEALIHEADLALYAAKSAGRNRTVIAQTGHQPNGSKSHPASA